MDVRQTKMAANSGILIINQPLTEEKQEEEGGGGGL